jgi:hypothetical protein
MHVFQLWEAFTLHDEETAGQMADASAPVSSERPQMRAVSPARDSDASLLACAASIVVNTWLTPSLIAGIPHA